MGVVGKRNWVAKDGDDESIREAPSEENKTHIEKDNLRMRR